jgi:small subunit ribosomal protein S6
VKTYEAMFLMDPSVVANFSIAEAEINRILQRAEAKLLGVKNWGERKLAYPIRQVRRGLYVLTYFEAQPEKIVGIERDVRLSEQTVRVLVLCREGMTREAVDKALAAEPPPKVPVREEWGSRPRSDGQWGGPSGMGRAPTGPGEDVADVSSVALAEGEEGADVDDARMDEGAGPGK